MVAGYPYFRKALNGHLSGSHLATAWVCLKALCCHMISVHVNASLLSVVLNSSRWAGGIVEYANVRFRGRRNGAQIVWRVYFLDWDHWHAVSRCLRSHMNTIAREPCDSFYIECVLQRKYDQKNILWREGSTARHPDESFFYRLGPPRNTWIPPKKRSKMK